MGTGYSLHIYLLLCICVCCCCFSCLFVPLFFTLVRLFVVIAFQSGQKSLKFHCKVNCIKRYLYHYCPNMAKLYLSHWKSWISIWTLYRNHYAKREIVNCRIHGFIQTFRHRWRILSARDEWRVYAMFTNKNVISTSVQPNLR